MEVTVDVANQGGNVLATISSPRMVAKTVVYGGFDHAADSLINRIISNNLDTKAVQANTH